MAEDRSPAPAPTDSAAPAAVAAGGGFKAWLPLIITVVLMPLLAFGMTQFVLVPQLQNGLGITAAHDDAPAATKHKKEGAKKEGAKEKGVTVPMNKLLVNVAGTMGARYLMVSLAIVGTGADFKAQVEEREAQMRDAACGVLGSKTLTDLEKPGERNLIRSELIASFNGILGDSIVQDIYFPEFAIQ